jgi:hypothetical protein
MVLNLTQAAYFLRGTFGSRQLLSGATTLSTSKALFWRLVQALVIWIQLGFWETQMQPAFIRTLLYSG